MNDFWKVFKLKEISKVVTGATPSTIIDEYYGNDIPFVSPADLGINKYISSSQKMLSYKGADQVRILPEGSVLFTCIGIIGKTGIASRKLTTNQQINAVICKDGFDSEYIYYALTFNSPQIKLLAGVQTVPIINKSFFENIKIPIPPLPEQRKIAEILSTWDEAIAKTDQLIEALRQRKKGLMQRLLTGQVRFPGFEDEWSAMKQGSVVRFINGRAYKKTEWEKFGIPVVRLQNLTGSGDNYYYSTLELPEEKYMKNGDLLYMWSATFGPHIWKGDRAIFHYHIWRIECSDLINKLFFYYLLEHLTGQWMSQSHGMGLLHITKETMENLIIRIPLIIEQEKISDVLLLNDNEIKLLRKKLDLLNQQKKGLMQRLLTGKVRVNV